MQARHLEVYELARRLTPGFRWTPCVVLAFVALWPTRRARRGRAQPGRAGRPGGAVGAALPRRHRTAQPRGLGADHRVVLLLLAAGTVLRVRRASTARAPGARCLLDLRYLPFLWLVAWRSAPRDGRRIVFVGLGADRLALDRSMARCRPLTGCSLGGANSSDRLSGIFGAGNLKLGLVLASLSPFALDAAARALPRAGWMLAALRSAPSSCWPARAPPGWCTRWCCCSAAGAGSAAEAAGADDGRRRPSASVLVLSLLVRSSRVASNAASPALSADRSGLDEALSGRLQHLARGRRHDRASIRSTASASAVSATPMRRTPRPMISGSATASRARCTRTRSCWRS